MHSPVTTTPRAVKPWPISGRKLAYRLRRASPAFRTSLAIDLLRGQVELRDLTVKQVCLLTGCSRAQLNVVRRAWAGCSLRELQHKQRADRLVARLGADHVMAALDRITQPNGSAADSNTPTNGSANDNSAATTLGGRIHLARRGKQLSLRTVGGACGVTPQAVGQWEHNQAKPEIDRLTRLAEILEIDVEALLTQDNATSAALADRFNLAL